MNKCFPLLRSIDFTRSLNHKIRSALHWVGCTAITTLQPKLLDAISESGTGGLCAELLILGVDGHPDSFVDMASIRLTSLFVTTEAMYRRGAAATHKLS